MPFTLEDLDRIVVRVGVGTKSLRQISDTQFTAWLRAQGARGEIGVIKMGPGELVIPIEERVSTLALIRWLSNARMRTSLAPASTCTRWKPRSQTWARSIRG